MNKNIVSEHVIKEGISPKYKGFNYLVCCIEELLKEENPCEVPVYAISSIVAKKFNSNSERVERAMRTAVKSANKNNTVKGLIFKIIYDMRGE